MKDQKHLEQHSIHPLDLPPELSQEVWHAFMTGGGLPPQLHVHAPWYHSNHIRPWVRRMPSEPRCRICYYPFGGIGGRLSRLLFGIRPSNMNPYFCNECEALVEHFPGGAEVEVTVLFADVRDSTTMAETMKPAEFSRLIRRFYNVAASALFDTNAIVEKLVGDAVTGFYAPGLAGPNHARKALEAAHRILQKTGSGGSSGPWAPVGIGLHTGIAFVGSVTSESGVANIAVLGDTANIGARLASLAKAGEIYLSQATAEAAGLDTSGLQQQHLSLKGRSQPVDAWVLTPSS